MPYIDNPEHQFAKSYQQSNLLSKNYIAKYVLVSLTFFMIAFLRNLFILVVSRPNDTIPSPPHYGSPAAPPMSSPMSNYWPVWGEFHIPTMMQIFVASMVLLSFIAILLYYHRRGNLPIAVSAIFGVVIIILTNMIQGPSQVASSIGGASEIYWDAVRISNPLDFIINYNDLQHSLSVHAETQPPGAVLVIYLLSLLFSTPLTLAIALATITGLFSAFFVNSILQNFLDDDTARFGSFLYLLLPAVQIYYLANIYAVVATCMFGLLACYLHQNKFIRLVGSLLFLFVGTFISFLFVVGPAGLFFYEMFESLRQTKDLVLVERIRHFAYRITPLLFTCILTGIGYLLLYFTLDFNYLEAFLHASATENPNGFMLLANPLEYIDTRMQNILDIAIFFGPVLIVLFGTGLMEIRTNELACDSERAAYSLVKGFLIAIFLLFLTGAPKKGETARICMFILPLMILPVLLFIQRNNYSRKDRCILLLLVFLQSVIMQLIGTYVW